MEMVGATARTAVRLRASSSPALPAGFGPLAARQFTGLPAFTLAPTLGSTPTVSLSLFHEKKSPKDSFFHKMVEMVGVEPTSESISTGLSPSAVNDLKFRLFRRPLTGCEIGYPVGPL